MNAKGSGQPRMTIYDLAQAAGVSTATVSRALKNDPLIKLETRIRIKDMAEKLSYRPSSIAASLARGRSGRIGLLLPHIRNPFYSTLNATLIDTARERGYEIVTGYLESGTDKMLSSFLNMHLDGIIMEIRDWSENAARIAEIAARPGAKPIVLRRRVEDSYPLDAIYPDLSGAAVTVTEYLLKLGHRSIAFFGTQDEERGTSFKKTVAKCKPKVRSSFINTDPTPQATYESALSVLSGKNRPTAIITMNDYCAFGALRAAAELKIRIPEELSIVGFDDIELSSFGYIPLTTMRLPTDKLASSLLDMIIARIEGDKTPPKHEMMPLTLVERASSGPVKA